MKISSTPDPLWNERLKSISTGTIYQTKEYAEYTSKVMKCKPEFITFERGKNITGQLVLINNTSTVRSLLGKNVYKWTYGPVIFEREDTSAIFDELTEYLKSKRGVIEGHAHPLQGFESSFSKEWGTFLIDLSATEEKLWNNMEKNSARNNVRRALEKQVYVKEIDDSTLHDYYLLFKEKRRKEGIEIEFKDMLFFWNVLKQVGFTGFIAYHNERAIGGILVSHFNGYINEWGIARSEIDTLERYYAQDQLKWHIIKWGKDKGCRYFDLSGVDPNPKSEKDRNLFRYKEKFGGRLIKYAVYQ